MPTIFRESGFRFVVHFDDHPPAHVHVWHAGLIARINIGSATARPSVSDVGGMPTTSLRLAVRIVEREQELFLEAWSAIHGTP